MMWLCVEDLKNLPQKQKTKQQSSSQKTPLRILQISLLIWLPDAIPGNPRLPAPIGETTTNFQVPGIQCNHLQCEPDDGARPGSIYTKIGMIQWTR